MSDVKLTKNGLRDQERRLAQLDRYLPTLKLKKAMLQVEVNEARQEILLLQQKYDKELDVAQGYCTLLTEKTVIDPLEVTKVVDIQKRYENIAGIEVPYFDGATFQEVEYSLFDTPPWVDGVINGLRALSEILVEINVVREKKAALEEELRSVSIRVNLFEKILIPRALKNIKKIKVFLGDQQLAAVGQVKVAKTKIEAKKEKLLKELMGAE
ncbi:MAG: V-type ATP synthase subunit D [Chlamydiae bacterium]|nr:V-type ATP synthase subunit D [Chlamydiota bacterium]